MRRFSTDGADVYDRHLEPEHHTVGKTHTQTIERTHLTFRTRLKRFVRKTICFSKSMRLHDIVIGLLVNRYEFGMLIWKRKQHIWNITKQHCWNTTVPMAGDVSLAHHGVLFLDEWPEFRHRVIEVVRQPIEESLRRI
jgi:hypothetical protein